MIPPKYAGYFSIASMLLWTFSALAIGYLFVHGHTAPAEDGRTSVSLSEGERAAAHREMRQLLASLNGVANGVAQGDTTGAFASARASGDALMQKMRDEYPAMQLKLPADYRERSIGVYLEFDRTAELINRGASEREILASIGAITARCVACHNSYRFH